MLGVTSSKASRSMLCSRLNTSVFFLCLFLSVSRYSIDSTPQSQMEVLNTIKDREEHEVFAVSLFFF